MVKIDGFEGRITDISTRYTVIRALSGRESIVPNEMLITQRVENSSLADPKVAINTTVQVAYGTDLDLLMPRLASAIATVPRVIADPAPGVQLSSFAADGLELSIWFWIERPAQRPGQRAQRRQPGDPAHAQRRRRPDPVSAACAAQRRRAVLCALTDADQVAGNTATRASATVIRSVSAS